MGLLSRLDRIAARLNRRLDSTAAAASIEQSGHGSGASVNPIGVKVGIDESAAQTRPEPADEGNEPTA
jgi:hypothetical protein